MKKILALFLILFLLCVGFYWLGLPNLTVEDHSIGVIYTKSSGYELITEENRNRWDIRKLLPRNYKVLSFSQEFQSFPITINANLPQADLLKNTLPVEDHVSKDVFSLHLNGDVTFRLKAQELIPLLENNQINNHDLNQFYQEEADRINAFLYQQFLYPSSETLRNITQSMLLTILQNEFSHLEFKHITITHMDLPSHDLYQQAQIHLDEATKESNQLQQELIYQLHQLEMDTQKEKLTWDNELEKLERIGALLTKYPILIAYLALMHELPAESPFVLPFIEKALMPSPPEEESE